MILSVLSCVMDPRSNKTVKGHITAQYIIARSVFLIPVIASGSMVRIKIKRNQKVSNQHALEGFFFPVGAIEEMYVHPVSFEEYIYNANKLLYEKIVGAYNNKIPLDNSIHEMAMDELYRYLLIGGMPENVKMYLVSP